MEDPMRLHKLQPAVSQKPNGFNKCHLQLAKALGKSTNSEHSDAVIGAENRLISLH
jgi:hypothetical protein